MNESLSRNARFNYLWAGQTASQFGFQIAALAMSTMAIVLLNATSTQIGILNALQTLAFLLIGLPAGAWVDQWRKRRTMIMADLVRVVGLASVPIAWWMGNLSIYHLMVVAAVFGFCTVFFDVAYQSYVPRIVGSQQIGEANGRMEASFQVARIGGPGLAGWLLGLMSAPVTFMFTAGTCAISAAAIWAIRDGEPKPEKRQDVRLVEQIAEGIRYVRGERLLGPLFLCIAFAAFWGQGVYTLLPILALRELGISATTLGALLSFGAIGGLLGAASVGRMVDRLGEGHAIIVCNFFGVMANFGLPLAVLAGEHAAAVIVGANLVGSFFQTIYNVTQMSFRQRICPPHLLGRLNATFRFAVWGMMPLGAFFSGVLAEHIGVTMALTACVSGTLVATFAMAFTPVVRLNGAGPMHAGVEAVLDAE